MTTFGERGDALLRQVWADLQAANRRNEAEAAKREPDKHRLTRVMKSGASTNYTYWQGATRRINKRRQERTSFCVAHHRNAAGVFLLWREVARYKLIRTKWSWYETERFDYQWATSKKELRDIAERKSKNDKLDLAHECASKLPNAPIEAQQMLAAAIG